MILLILVLTVAWWLMRHSATPAIPPKPKIDPRRLLAAQLIEAAKVARRTRPPRGLHRAHRSPGRAMRSWNGPARSPTG